MLLSFSPSSFDLESSDLSPLAIEQPSFCFNELLLIVYLLDNANLYSILNIFAPLLISFTDWSSQRLVHLSCRFDKGELEQDAPLS